MDSRTPEPTNPNDDDDETNREGDIEEKRPRMLW
jgi:hypothetical protein